MQIMLFPANIMSSTYTNNVMNEELFIFMIRERSERDWTKL